MELGTYRIVAELGAGGMGEVYRARDARLDRDVAVKVLPAHLATDPDALARFRREAKAVAALSHPNILAIHDVGTDRGIDYAVMELLEGQTLREVLGHGALPLRKALEYAVQIAHGLAAAHDKGIVHRDLKPENVFLTNDGHLKILDFGLARQNPLFPIADVTGSPTVSHTDAGMIVGTLGYMSPEQVRGEPATHRSDIFAFGSLLYEMLTGARAFRRTTAPETMTAILRDDVPELPAEVAMTARGVAPILVHCLEKRPEDRFQSARDLAFDLRIASGSLTMSGPVRDSLPSGRLAATGRIARPLGWLLAGVLLAAAESSFLSSSGRLVHPKIRRLTFSGADSAPSATPDGRIVAFTSTRDGLSRIWIKQLAGGGEQALTSGPDILPRFSPDGQSVLFVRDEGQSQSLYRVALVGGEPRKLIHDAVDGDWSPDGREIAFVRTRTEPGRIFAGLYVADLQGQKERRLTELENANLYGVRWSSSGREIVVTNANIATTAVRSCLIRIDVASGRQATWPKDGGELPLSASLFVDDGHEVVLAQSESTLGNLTAAQSRVMAVGPGHDRERVLFWAADLFASGGASNAFPILDVLGPGRIVFDTVEERQKLVEVASGNAPAGERVLTRGPSVDRQPAYSPDGQFVVFSSNRTGNLDLSVLAPKTGAVRQITEDPADDWDPAFTPDGRQIVWSSRRSGSLEVWISDADGSGARQITRLGTGAENPTVTRDGWVVYADNNPAPDAMGIWKVRLDGRDAHRLLGGPYIVPEVSPDGRYALAVVATGWLHNQIQVVEVESGALVPFTIEVSYGLNAPNIAHGRARWLPDGRAIAFVGFDEKGRSGIFAQDFTPGRDSAATRRVLAGFSPILVPESFGISPDGRRLMLSTLEQSGSLMVAEGVPGVAPQRRRMP
jgi:eukaryotic-like serine/threonine-protein kinase